MPVPFTARGQKVFAEDKQLEAYVRAGNVEVVFDNGFTFTIIADSITDNAKAFDLNIAIGLASNSTRIGGVNVPANSIIINPNFNGEFGFDIQFTFTAQQLRSAGINGNNVRLWYVDHNGNVTDSGRLRLNADGSVDFTINRASYYVLSETAPVGTNAASNPPTSVAIGFTAAIIAGIAVIVSKKRKTYPN